MRKYTLIIVTLLIANCKTQVKYGHQALMDYDVINNSLFYVDKSPDLNNISFTSLVYDEEFVITKFPNLLVNFVNPKISEKGLAKIDSIRNLRGKTTEETKILEETIKNRYFTPKTTNFLNDKDFEHMSRNANIKINWNQSMLYNGITLSKNKKMGLRVSKPMYSTNQNYAAYFVESSSSLDVIFCQRKNGRWEFYCSATVWIE